MKSVISWMILGLFLVSWFFVLTAPIEIYNVLKARSWEPTKVRIIQSEIVYHHMSKNSSNTSHVIKVKDLVTNQEHSKVRVSFASFSFSVRSLTYNWSSAEADVEKYFVGKELVAFKGEDDSYVLEQGSVWFPVLLFILSLILPVRTFIYVRKKA